MRDNYAQITVLEAVVAIGMVFLSVAFTYQQLQTPAVHLTVSPSVQLKNLCDEILYSIWRSPASNPNMYQNSKLVECIAFNNTKELCERINRSLPPNVFYNLWLYDGVARYLLYPMNGRPNEGVGDIVVAHQIIVYNGTAYSVEMEAWRI